MRKQRELLTLSTDSMLWALLMGHDELAVSLWQQVCKEFYLYAHESNL